MVFPNTKTGVGIKGGECVKLHYIDENGEDQGTTFPKGTKIGWFISNDAFTKRVKRPAVLVKDSECFIRPLP